MGRSDDVSQVALNREIDRIIAGFELELSQVYESVNTSTLTRTYSTYLISASPNIKHFAARFKGNRQIIKSWTRRLPL